MTSTRLRLLALGAAASSGLGAVLAGVGVGIAASSWLVGILVALGLGLLAGGLLIGVGALLLSLRGVQRASASSARETAAVRKDVSRIMWRTEPVRATAGSIGRVREQLDLLLQPTTQNKKRFAAVARGEVRRVLQRDPTGAPEAETGGEAGSAVDEVPTGAIGAVLGSISGLTQDASRPFSLLDPDAGTLPEQATALVIDESALFTGPWAESPDGPVRFGELARAARTADVPVLLLAVHGGEHAGRAALREQVDGIIDGSTWVKEPGAADGERIRLALTALLALGVRVRDDAADSEPESGE